LRAGAGNAPPVRWRIRARDIGAPIAGRGDPHALRWETLARSEPIARGVVPAGQIGLTPAQHDRRLILATVREAGARVAAVLEGVGAEVLRLGHGDVDGVRLVEALGKRGLRLVYSIAGPAVLHMLISRRVLRRIYLTTVMRVLAGDSFATLARGALLEPPYDFRLAALYLDRHGPDGVEQLFQVYDRREDPPASPTDSI
jgi:hypothetical protein